MSYVCTSDYSFTVRRQPLWRETLSDPMNTEHDSTTDTTRFPAGNPDTMDDDTLQPESSKKECANTPTKPRASVGQPDTPSTASKKKTRTAIFITSAKAGADKTAAQRCELTEEQISANEDIMNKSRSTPMRMKEQGLVKIILDNKETRQGGFGHLGTWERCGP